MRNASVEERLTALERETRKPTVAGSAAAAASAASVVLKALGMIGAAEEELDQAAACRDHPGGTRAEANDEAAAGAGIRRADDRGRSPACGLCQGTGGGEC